MGTRFVSWNLVLYKPAKNIILKISTKFEKVAELCNVCWFEIRGKISVKMLSKGTHYSVYLVFKRASSRSYGFDHTPIETEVGFTGKEVRKTFVFLEPSDTDPRSGYGYSGFR